MCNHQSSIFNSSQGTETSLTYHGTLVTLSSCSAPSKMSANDGPLAPTYVMRWAGGYAQ